MKTKVNNVNKTNYIITNTSNIFIYITNTSNIYKLKMVVWKISGLIVKVDVM